MSIKHVGMSILFFIMSILGHLGFTDVNENNIENYVAKDSLSVATFIEDNFDTFVYEYNSANNDGETWAATEIEKTFAITVNECGEEYDGVFMDFNDDNGYAVVATITIY